MYIACSADDDAAARADDFACLFRILVAVADFSFGDDVTSNVNLVTLGLQLLMPLVTPDLLAFKQVAVSFFDCVTTLVRFNPDIVASANPTVFASIKSALHFGVQFYDTDIVRSSLESISELAESHAMSGKLSIQMQTDPALLNDFLSWVVGFIINHAFNGGLVNTAANTILSILVSSHATYQSFVEAHIGSVAPSVRDAVANSWQALLEGIANDLSRSNRRKFQSNVIAFLSKMKGLVCIR